MSVFTLCFCGTDCWPDEGVVDRSSTGGSAPGIYGDAGYIPVGVYEEIQASREQGKVVIPGPGAPWAHYYRTLWVPPTTNVKATVDSVGGYSMWDLAGHAAACVVGVPSSGRGDQVKDHIKEVTDIIKAIKTSVGADVNPEASRKPPSNKCYQFSAPTLKLLHDHIQGRRDGGGSAVSAINIIGHSRGGVASIMCAHELNYLFPDVPVSIFAIDPVPGPGVLSPEMTQLAPNVVNYVGVYAIDETSGGFNGLVPRPRAQGAYIDPLHPTPTSSARTQVPRYHLLYAPGRHGTVAGNKTSDGKAVASKATTEAAAVGKLIGSLARACLRQWGTDIAPLRLTPNIATARGLMTQHADHYRAMRAFTYLGDGHSYQHWYERGVTSSDGRNSSDWHYLEDAIGAAPLVERVSNIPDMMRKARPHPGRVAWEAIQDVSDSVFRNGYWTGES